MWRRGTRRSVVADTHQLGAVANGVDSRVLHDNALVTDKKHLEGLDLWRARQRARAMVSREVRAARARAAKERHSGKVHCDTVTATTALQPLKRTHHTPEVCLVPRLIVVVLRIKDIVHGHHGILC